MPAAQAFKKQDPRANYSDLMAMKLSGLENDVVNVCSCGCPDEDLDENGYCDHLIGFTTDKKFVEPMRKVYGQTPDGEQTESWRYVVDGSRQLPMPPGCKLVRITSSYRVYRAEPLQLDAKKTPAK